MSENECKAESWIRTPCKSNSGDLTGTREEASQWLIPCVCRTEKLSGKNKYRCENCMTRCEGSLKSQITEPPQILVFHLKRFENESPGSSNLEEDEEEGSSPSYCSWSLTLPKKITDDVPLPLTMRCFMDNCSKERKRKLKQDRLRFIKRERIEVEVKRNARRLTRNFDKAKIQKSGEREG